MFVCLSFWKPVALSCLMLLPVRSSSSTHAPRCSGTHPSRTHAAHLGFTDSPDMPDTSPLGGPVWEIALNHQGLDIEPSDWGENYKIKQLCGGGGKDGDVWFSCDRYMLWYDSSARGPELWGFSGDNRAWAKTVIGFGTEVCCGMDNKLPW